jgi:hypothetical protein
MDAARRSANNVFDIKKPFRLMAPLAARNQKTKYTAADIKVDARPTSFYVVLSAPYCFSNFCLAAAAFRQLEFIFPIALFISCSCAATSLLDFRRAASCASRIH